MKFVSIMMVVCGVLAYCFSFKGVNEEKEEAMLVHIASLLLLTGGYLLGIFLCDMHNSVLFVGSGFAVYFLIGTRNLSILWAANRKRWSMMGVACAGLVFSLTRQNFTILDAFILCAALCLSTSPLFNPKEQNEDVEQ